MFDFDPRDYDSRDDERHGSTPNRGNRGASDDRDRDDDWRQPDFRPRNREAEDARMLGRGPGSNQKDSDEHGRDRHDDARLAERDRDGREREREARHTFTPGRAHGVVHVSVPRAQLRARCEGGCVSDHGPSRGQREHVMLPSLSVVDAVAPGVDRQCARRFFSDDTSGPGKLLTRGDITVSNPAYGVRTNEAWPGPNAASGSLVSGRCLRVRWGHVCDGRRWWQSCPVQALPGPGASAPPEPGQGHDRSRGGCVRRSQATRTGAATRQALLCESSLTPAF